MLLFMLFALSRLTFSTDTTTAESGGLLQDPEFRIGIAVVLAVPAFLFLRHFAGAFDVSAENDLADAEAEGRDAARSLTLARDELAAAEEQADLRTRALDRQRVHPRYRAVAANPLPWPRLYHSRE